MIIEKKQLIDGLNADDAEHLLGPGDCLNMENFRIGGSETGKDGDIENIPGTKMLYSNVWAAGISTTILRCRDEARKRLIFFNYDTQGHHRILCYDIQNNTGYTVLLNEDVVGGLNFKSEKIHSCFIVNDCLYWVDGTNNEPRRLNIERGIKAYQPSYVTDLTPYSLPIKQNILSWIRRPPGLPPTQIKVAQTIPALANNQIRYESMQFCYNYSYQDNELSTLSSTSTLAPYNDNNDNTFNRVDILIPFQEKIEQDVLKINLVVRFVSTDTYSIIKTWDRTITADAAAISNHNNGVSQLSYSFYNNQVTIPLSKDYYIKPFDSIPNFSETTEVARNRGYFGNYTIGYDTPKKGTSLVAAINHVSTYSLGGILVVGTSAKITGVTIGGTPVAYVSGSTLPIISGEISVYSTNNSGPSRTVVISVLGSCTTVRVRYSIDGSTFTNVDKPYTGDGDYAFTGIPINTSGVFITWICALL